MKKLIPVIVGVLIGALAGWFGHENLGGGIDELYRSNVEARVIAVSAPEEAGLEEAPRGADEEERLVLHLHTSAGLILAVFTERADDVRELIREGDIVTLSLPPDQPVVDNPPVLKVERRSLQRAIRRRPTFDRRFRRVHDDEDDEDEGDDESLDDDESSDGESDEESADEEDSDNERTEATPVARNAAERRGAARNGERDDTATQAENQQADSRSATPEGEDSDTSSDTAEEAAPEEVPQRPSRRRRRGKAGTDND